MTDCALVPDDSFAALDDRCDVSRKLGPTSGNTDRNKQWRRVILTAPCLEKPEKKSLMMFTTLQLRVTNSGVHSYLESL